MFNLFFLFLYLSNSIILDSQTYITKKEITKLQLNFTKAEFSNTSHLFINLVPLSESLQTFLLICHQQPNNIEIEKLFEQGCMADIVSYQKKNIQTLYLTQTYYSQSISELYSIFTTHTFNFYLAVISNDKENQFQVILKQENINTCPKPCQNNGICIKGFCECREGYINSDCSQMILNIEQQITLFPNISYYYELKSINQSPFTRYFQNTIHYEFYCYPQYSFNFQQQIIVSDYITLNSQYIKQCYQYSEQYSQEISHTIQIYILIQLLENNEIEIFRIEEYTLFRNIIYILIVVFIISIFIILLILHKQKNSPTKIMLKLVPLMKFSQFQEYNESINKEIDCCLCMKSIIQTQSIRLTYCNHIFHDFCFKIWWTNKQSCPLCRSPLDIETIKKNSKTQDNLQSSTISQIVTQRKKNLITYVDTGSAKRQLTFQQQLELQNV